MNDNVREFPFNVNKVVAILEKYLEQMAPPTPETSLRSAEQMLWDQIVLTRVGQGHPTDAAIEDATRAVKARREVLK